MHVLVLNQLLCCNMHTASYSSYMYSSFFKAFFHCTLIGICSDWLTCTGIQSIDEGKKDKVEFFKFFSRCAQRKAAKLSRKRLAFYALIFPHFLGREKLKASKIFFQNRKKIRSQRHRKYGLHRLLIQKHHGHSSRNLCSRFFLVHRQGVRRCDQYWCQISSSFSVFALLLLLPQALNVPRRLLLHHRA